jgi:hypothetical protein
MTNKYIVVTAITHNRVRFVIPMDEVSEEDQLTEARTLVENDDVQEFSQTPLTMDIVGTVAMTTDQVRKLFDEEVGLADWSEEDIAEYIADWYNDDEYELIEKD